MLYVYMELVNHTATFKTALLNDVHMDGKQIILNMTYANKIADEDSPNGFYLEKIDEGTKNVTIADEVPIYFLQGASTYYLATWEDVRKHNGFFRLYENDGEVVFIIQSYIP